VLVSVQSSSLQVIPNFRIRTIPVLGTSPALFGMAAASWILCQLAQQPFFPEPVWRVRRGQYETILENLTDDEYARCGHCDDVAVDLEEVRRACAKHLCQCAQALHSPCQGVCACRFRFW
jgi:hypothetical protein